LPLFTYHHTYQYDAQNRRIEKLLQHAHNFERETFEYNDHGDAISRISEGRGGGGFDVGEDGQLIIKEEPLHSRHNESRFRYQYDSHNNWIEKISESPDGQVCSIEQRTITYYSANVK